jgi:hypothetical protein
MFKDLDDRDDRDNKDNKDNGSRLYDFNSLDTSTNDQNLQKKIAFLRQDNVTK